MLGNTGTVAGATAKLVRRDNGLAFQVHTRGLIPGNAYTLWLVVINNPDACATQVPFCSPVDVLQTPPTDSQVLWAAGTVAGGSGQATFAGSAKVGPLDGWLADRALTNPAGAEVRLIVNDHGPKIPALMPDMIKTYRGGCADTSPFPPVFPDTALADGIPGPNECRLFQAAVFEVS